MRCATCSHNRGRQHVRGVSHIPSDPASCDARIWRHQSVPGNRDSCRDVSERTGSCSFFLPVLRHRRLALLSVRAINPRDGFSVLDYVPWPFPFLHVDDPPIRSHRYLAFLLARIARRTSSTEARRYSSERRECSSSDSRLRVRSIAGLTRPEQSRPRALRKALL